MNHANSQRAQIINSALFSFWGSFPLTNQQYHAPLKEPETINTMSSLGTINSLSSPKTLSKKNFRLCAQCPHRLLDFWKHEATPESEEEMKANESTAEHPKASRDAPTSDVGEVS